jgi:hypothetical protein
MRGALPVTDGTTPRRAEGRHRVSASMEGTDVPMGVLALLLRAQDEPAKLCKTEGVEGICFAAPSEGCVFVLTVMPNVKMTGAQQNAAKPPPAVVSPSPLTCYPLIIRERQ